MGVASEGPNDDGGVETRSGAAAVVAAGVGMEGMAGVVPRGATGFGGGTMDSEAVADTGCDAWLDGIADGDSWA